VQIIAKKTVLFSRKDGEAIVFVNSFFVVLK
jgi:hypothetical protein